jgi:hypothetical protein
MKVGINFVHFSWSKVSIILTLGFILLTLAWAKVSKMKPRFNIMLKNALFSTKHPNLENNY